MTLKSKIFCTIDLNHLLFDVIGWEHSRLSCTFNAPRHPSAINWIYLKNQVTFRETHFVWKLLHKIFNYFQVLKLFLKNENWLDGLKMRVVNRNNVRSSSKILKKSSKNLLQFIHEVTEYSRIYLHEIIPRILHFHILQLINLRKKRRRKLSSLWTFISE